jgi:hypothetical protein
VLLLCGFSVLIFFCSVACCLLVVCLVFGRVCVLLQGVLFFGLLAVCCKYFGTSCALFNIFIMPLSKK